MWRQLSAEQTSVGLILAALPPVPTGQFLWVKQSSLSVWCSPKNASSARSSEQTGNHKVQLLVSSFLLVSRCLWVFLWKCWLVGVTDCYHGNSAQSVSPIAAMETPVNGCFLVERLAPELLFLCPVGKSGCSHWLLSVALKMAGFCFSLLPVGSRAPVAEVLINDGLSYFQIMRSE